MSPSEFIDNVRQTSPELPPNDLLDLINDPEFRYSVCRELNKSVGTTDRALGRHLLQLDIDSLRGESSGMTDELRLSALLLYKIGNVEDAPLLWEAKTVNFDTVCGLDIQLLVGAGVDETIAYLRDLGDEQSLGAVSYIEGCRATGDFNHLDTYAGQWDKYFSN